MKKKFSHKVAKEIAQKSFLQMLDCVFGNSDADYSFSTPTDEYEQNFEEDLAEVGISVSPYKIGLISEKFDKMKDGLEQYVRRRYC